MRNFRGPYTNLDDPVRALERKREIQRVGVDMSAPACKPPSCNMGEGSVIVKLANTNNLYKGGDPSVTGKVPSRFYSDAALTPVFNEKLVSRAVSKYKAANARAATNSKGNEVDLTRWYSLRYPLAQMLMKRLRT